MVTYFFFVLLYFFWIFRKIKNLLLILFKRIIINKIKKQGKYNLLVKYALSSISKYIVILNYQYVFKLNKNPKEIYFFFNFSSFD
jgi:hypothetical protein